MLFRSKKCLDEPISMNQRIGEDDDSEMGDFITDENAQSPEDSAMSSSISEDLKEVFEKAKLTEREKGIIILRFGILDGRPRTLEEVGKVFNVTRERIRQVEVKALRKLRKPANKKELFKYLRH